MSGLIHDIDLPDIACPKPVWAGNSISIICNREEVAQAARGEDPLRLLFITEVRDLVFSARPAKVIDSDGPLLSLSSVVIKGMAPWRRSITLKSETGEERKARLITAVDALLSSELNKG